VKDIRGPIVLESRDSYIGSLRNSHEYGNHEYGNVDTGLRQRRTSHAGILAAGKLSVCGVKRGVLSNCA